MGWFSRGPKVGADWVARLEAVERSQKGIEIEWNEWFDKYRRLYARLAKRAEQQETADAAPSGIDGRSPSHQPNPVAMALLRGRSGG